MTSREPIGIDLHPVMATRPCTFCLSLQGGSVFADFEVDQDGLVKLRRISFDGYGCCHTESSIPSMRRDDSQALVAAVEQDNLAAPELSAVLRRYFSENSKHLWRDALEENALL